MKKHFNLVLAHLMLMPIIGPHVRICVWEIVKQERQNRISHNQACQVTQLNCCAGIDRDRHGIS